MASCDIQLGNLSVLSRIESFMNDTAYREAIENSANYNTRLCIERRLRLPFLDSQTGIAQNHSNLFMTGRERIPGLSDGQVYTYPSKRWRKKRRQYLMQPQVQMRRCENTPSGELIGDLHTISTVENPAISAPSDDSKDSANTVLKDDSSAKTSQDAWYYDELDLQAMEGFDDADPDSDYDYEETYSKRRKKRGAPGKPKSTTPDSPHQKKGPKATGQGRGRKKGVNYADLTDSEKPFSCDLCGARYKTRPGLTYHYTHSHKEGTSSSVSSGRSSSGNSSNSNSGSGGGGGGSGGGGGGSGGGGNASMSVGVLLPPPDEESTPDSSQPPPPSPQDNPAPGWTKLQDSYLTFLNAPGGSSGRRGRPNSTGTVQPVQPSIPPTPHDDLPPLSGPSVEKKPMPEQILVMEQNEKERAAPSPYCDFCLGDAVSNKKSGQPEELVSCSDCGRSGHPTCLQFTDNMIVSVRKYRWQCIECKCCSICGNSDNDDQLLFCDDCDRGYHMYCLAPPLLTPPEGSWSCRLCLIEFHTK